MWLIWLLESVCLLSLLVVVGVWVKHKPVKARKLQRNNKGRHAQWDFIEGGEISKSLRRFDQGTDFQVTNNSQIRSNLE